ALSRPRLRLSVDCVLSLLPTSRYLVLSQPISRERNPIDGVPRALLGAPRSPATPLGASASLRRRLLTSPESPTHLQLSSCQIQRPDAAPQQPSRSASAVPPLQRPAA